MPTYTVMIEEGSWDRPWAVEAHLDFKRAAGVAAQLIRANKERKVAVWQEDAKGFARIESAWKECYTHKVYYDGIYDENPRPFRGEIKYITAAMGNALKEEAIWPPLN